MAVDVAGEVTLAVPVSVVVMAGKEAVVVLVVADTMSC